MSKKERSELLQFNYALYGVKELPARQVNKRPAPKIVEAEPQSFERGFAGINIIGRIGTDPELRYTPEGTAVCNIRIAVNHGEDEVSWFTVTAWGAQAEFVNLYLAKGRRIFVSGNFRSREYQTKEGEDRISLDINANSIQFADSKPVDE